MSGHAASRFEHGSRVPGWDAPADLDKDPATIPDPGTTSRSRRAARGDRGAHGPLSGPPLRRAAGAAGRAARARLVLARGDRAGRVRDGRDARLPESVATLLRHARDRARGAPQRLRVHEHLLLAVRRRRAVRGDARGRRGDDPDVQRARVRVPRRVRHRADGLRRRRLRRPALARGRAARCWRTCARDAPVLPDKQLARSLVADPHANTRSSRAAARCEATHGDERRCCCSRTSTSRA